MYTVSHVCGHDLRTQRHAANRAKFSDSVFNLSLLLGCDECSQDLSTGPETEPEAHFISHEFFRCDIRIEIAKF